MVKFKKCNSFLMGFINNIYYLRSKKEMPEPCPIKRVMQSLVRSLKVYCVLVRHPLHPVYFLREKIIFLAKSSAIGEKKYVARNSSCGHKQVSQEIRHRFSIHMKRKNAVLWYHVTGWPERTTAIREIKHRVYGQRQKSICTKWPSFPP